MSRVYLYKDADYSGKGPYKEVVTVIFGTFGGARIYVHKNRGDLWGEGLMNVTLDEKNSDIFQKYPDYDYFYYQTPGMRFTRKLCFERVMGPLDLDNPIHKYFYEREKKRLLWHEEKEMIF
jgi:hypothetical protein